MTCLSAARSSMSACIDSALSVSGRSSVSVATPRSATSLSVPNSMALLRSGVRFWLGSAALLVLAVLGPDGLLDASPVLVPVGPIRVEVASGGQGVASVDRDDLACHPIHPVGHQEGGEVL